MPKHAILAIPAIFFINFFPMQAIASEKKQEACKEKYLPRAETEAAFKIFSFACMDYHSSRPKPRRVMDNVRSNLYKILSNCNQVDLDDVSRKICSFDRELLQTSDAYFEATIVETLGAIDTNLDKSHFYSEDWHQYGEEVQRWEERKLWAKCALEHKEILMAKNDYSAELIHNNKCSKYFSN